MPPRKRTKRKIQELETHAVMPQSGFQFDWRDSCLTLASLHGYALKNQILTDVKILVGVQQKEFQCHKLILALGSKVFKSMFFDEPSEKNNVVSIPDVDPDAFNHLIWFVYTDQCKLGDYTTAFKVFYAAQKYSIKELKELCETFLSSYKLSPFDVWVFLENSILLNTEVAKENCVHFLKRGIESALEQSSFSAIKIETMDVLLSLDDLDIDEGILIKKVIDWADYQSKIEGADSFENILKPLLSKIHFKGLLPRQFIEIRHNTRLKEVLSTDDALAILEFLNDHLYELPDWCCTKSVRWEKSFNEDNQCEIGTLDDKSFQKLTRKKLEKKFLMSYLNEFETSSFPSSPESVHVPSDLDFDIANEIASLPSSPTSFDIANYMNSD